MKNKLSFLLLVAFIVNILAGCANSQTKNTELLPAETMTIDAGNYSFPSISRERAAEIEHFWQKHYLPAQKGQTIHKFCSPADKEEGIRYYGSCQVGNPSKTYDILFISHKSTDQSGVPYELHLGNHTIRHRSSFSLYVYQYLDASRIGLFSPLTANSFILEDEDLMESIVKTHEAYEQQIYGSVITRLPDLDDSTYEGRIQQLQRTWFVKFGTIPSFSEKGVLRYYGRFDDYDIVFEYGMLTVISSETIAGYKFENPNSFMLYAIKDGEFNTLKNAYTDGLISKQSVEQIWKIHSGITFEP